MRGREGKRSNRWGKIFHRCFDVVALFDSTTGRNDFSVKTFIDPNSVTNVGSTKREAMVQF
jgi:hypothetical protein